MRRCLKLLLISSLTFSLSCAGFFFYPQKDIVPNPHLEKFTYEDVFFRSLDGTELHGWYVYSEKDQPYGLVILFHGNAENISTHVNAVLWLVKEGFDAFVFDYRGYGLSQGHPTLEGAHLDGLSAIEKAYSIGRSKKLIVFGQSLGASVSVYCTANTPLKEHINLLILDSPFADYHLILEGKLRESVVLYPFSYLSSVLIDNYYSPLKWIDKVRPVPIFFIHGRNDRVIPYKHTLILAEVVNWQKKLVITEATHTLSLLYPEVRSYLLDMMFWSVSNE